MLKKAAPASAPAPQRRFRLSNAQFGMLLVSPLFVVLAVVVAYPLAYAMWASVQFFRLSRPDDIRFSGLENYARVLGDDGFRNALWHSLVYTFVAVPLELALGLVIAMALVRMRVGRDLARTLIVVPMMLAPVVMGLMWKFMYNDQLGVINQAARALGLVQGSIPWLSSPDLALWSLIIVEVWATTPVMVILLGAGLAVIPDELYEAARMDGASAWQRFARITLPLLQPIILVALLIRGMDAFRVFDLVYILTQGGPANATDVLSHFLYQRNFINLNVGQASAGAMVMLAILIVAGLILIRLLRREEPT